MTRSGPGLKFDGTACSKCGSVVRYVSNSQCVKCCNSRDRSGYMKGRYSGARRRALDYKVQLHTSHYRTSEPSPVSRGVLIALARDAGDAVRRQAGMYLGIPAYQQEVAKPPPMTAGDVWRSMLPVGASLYAPPPMNKRYEKSQPERSADYQELAASVAALVPALPDVVTTADVIGRLDPKLVQRLGKRLVVNLARALRSAGCARQKITVPGLKSAYLVRQADAYKRMGSRAIMAHRAARTFTRPGDPAPTGEKRGSGRNSRPALLPEEQARRKRERRAARRAAGIPRALRAASQRRKAADMAAGAANAPTPSAGPQEGINHAKVNDDHRNVMTARPGPVLWTGLY